MSSLLLTGKSFDRFALSSAFDETDLSLFELANDTSLIDCLKTEHPIALKVA